MGDGQQTVFTPASQLGGGAMHCMTFLHVQLVQKYTGCRIHGIGYLGLVRLDAK